MRIVHFLPLISLLAAFAATVQAVAEDTAAVAPATHVERRTEAFDQVRLVRELMRRRGGDPAATAQLIQLTRQFDATTAAELFDALARAHQQAGNLDLAAETRRMLVEQYADAPISGEAMLWLTRLYASSEVSHARRTVAVIGGNVGGARLVATTTVQDRAAEEGRALYAFNLSSAASTARADSALAFQRSVAARRAGLAKVAHNMLTPLKHAGANDAWADCARAESWLDEGRSEAPPKAVVHCAAALAPPELDGALNDACWQNQPSFDSRAAAANATEALVKNGTEVLWASDEEFLYVAVRCQKLTGVAYPRDDDRPRTHDGDVEAYDRVRVELDVDRDYATWFELTVDSRGWTADRCWEDSAWNPSWYVAAADNADPAAGQWIVEAAIPLSELAVEAPRACEAWACRVKRISPLEARTDAAAGAPPGPESFSLLLFE